MYKKTNLHQRKFVAKGDLKCRLCIVTDTHLGPVAGESPSPWHTNRLDGERFLNIVRQINSLEPDHIIHVGDMVHPLPNHPRYDDAAQRFFSISAECKSSISLVPGNHDIGDKVTRWMPAHPITSDFVAKYRSTFGADFNYFCIGDVAIIILNAQLLNSGLPEERAQMHWLQETLSETQGLRKIVFSHYPPFLTRYDEPEHYDNIAEPARTALLHSLASNEVECLVAGHVHNYFYNTYDSLELYTLPATSAVRHDYAFLFDSPPQPDDEYGRNDDDKLGFAVLDIFEKGHVLHFCRLNPGEEARPLNVADMQSGPGVPKRHDSGIGADLRGPWATSTALPFSGVVDEFYRKCVRNDYSLLALQAAGLSIIRIPVADLDHEETAARAGELYHAGFRIGVFAFNDLEPAETRALNDHRAIIDYLELIADSEQLTQLEAHGLPQIARSFPCYISPLRSSASASGSDGVFTHYIKHGYQAEGVLQPSKAKDSGASGVVFELRHDANIMKEMEAIDKICSENDMGAKVYLKLATGNPAIIENSDIAVARAVILTLLAKSRAISEIDVIIDTIIDVDRGYFPRCGLFDRRYNIKAGGIALSRCHEIVRSLAGTRFDVSQFASNEEEKIVVESEIFNVEFVLNCSEGVYPRIRINSVGDD